MVKTDWMSVRKWTEHSNAVVVECPKKDCVSCLKMRNPKY